MTHDDIPPRRCLCRMGKEERKANKSKQSERRLPGTTCGSGGETRSCTRKRNCTRSTRNCTSTRKRKRNRNRNRTSGSTSGSGSGSTSTRAGRKDALRGTSMARRGQMPQDPCYYYCDQYSTTTILLFRTVPFDPQRIVTIVTTSTTCTHARTHARSHKLFNRTTMGKRKTAKTGDKALYGSREKLANEASGGSRNKDDDDPMYDEVDRFHNDRDENFLRLEEEERGDSDDEDKHLAGNKHSVLDLGAGGTSSEDDDDSSSDEDDDDDDDDLDDTIAKRMLPDGMPRIL
mmetsp:Transcript_18867/g.43507  ORF Transcript_18867/g.43507 Transcript_18867/m.43507 type:complete len:289 (-) Transcript_18867:430-1296(-)